MSPEQYKHYLEERKRRGKRASTAIHFSLTKEDPRHLGMNPAFIGIDRDPKKVR